MDIGPLFQQIIQAGQEIKDDGSGLESHEVRTISDGCSSIIASSYGILEVQESVGSQNQVMVLGSSAAQEGQWFIQDLGDKQKSRYQHIDQSQFAKQVDKLVNQALKRVQQGSITNFVELRKYIAAGYHDIHQKIIDESGSGKDNLACTHARDDYPESFDCIRSPIKDFMERGYADQILDFVSEAEPDEQGSRTANYEAEITVDGKLHKIPLTRTTHNPDLELKDEQGQHVAAWNPVETKYFPIIDQHLDNLMERILQPETNQKDTVKLVAEMHFWQAHQFKYQKGSAAAADILCTTLLRANNIYKSKWNCQADVKAFLSRPETYIDNYPAFFK